MQEASTSGSTHPLESEASSDGDDGGRKRVFPSTISTLQVGLGGAGEFQGGAERVFSELERCLPSCGVRVCAVVASQGAEIPSDTFHRHVFAPPAASLLVRMIGARRVVGKLLQEHEFDLVACHFALYGLPLLDKIGKKPFVVHFHGPWAAESLEEGSGRIPAYVKHHVEQFVYTRSDRAIVLSNAFADVLIKKYRVSEQIVRVVPGSVDINRFAVPQTKREARDMMGWPQDRPILLSVRRLSKRMGLDLLTKAMPAIVRKFPDALLLIGGRGHLQKELELLIKELQLTAHVRLLGFIADDQLPLAYRAADLNIVPTRAWEGFGLVAAEAIAAGTPSLVTPIGGLPEIVSALAPNLILRSASIEDIADGIIQVLSSPSSLPDSAMCRAFAAEHFSSNKMAANTALVYREMLATS